MGVFARIPRLLAVALAVGLAGAAVAEPQGARCAGIADAGERLKCYDAESAQPPVETVLAGWVLERRRDPFTGATACVISPPGKPDVRVGREDMIIDFARRGGVARYRYRIDESEPSRARTLRRNDRAAQQVRFHGKAFDRILVSRRLVLEVTTYGAGVVVEDFDLAGLSAQHDRLLRECP